VFDLPDGAAAGAKTRGGGTECIYTGQVAGARTRPLALIGPLRDKLFPFSPLTGKRDRSARMFN